ncbi:hypothetical protein V8C35DRAFT_302911 [Trichoderma chlorosporum]
MAGAFQIIPCLDKVNSWQIIETKIAIALPIQGNNEQSFEWSRAVFKLKGRINTSTYMLFLEGFVFGSSVGSLNGDIRNGIHVDINHMMASGTADFSLRNNNEIWLNANVNAFGNHYVNEKIFSW